MLTAFGPGQASWAAGFFFLPAVPRALAAALTLALWSLAGVLFFSRLERLVGSWRGLWRDATRVRHVTMSLAAGPAFVTLYSFAGAPTLRLVPWVHQRFSILAVAAATLMLARRLPRTPQLFTEEALARNLIKHWEWSDVDPPRNLRDAFLLHPVRTRESQRSAAAILESYQQAVRVALVDGFVTREEVQQLQALRHQMDITPTDHDRIMAELAAEEGDVCSHPAVQVLAGSGNPGSRTPMPSTPLAHGSASSIERRTRPPLDHGPPDHPDGGRARGSPPRHSTREAHTRVAGRAGARTAVVTTRPCRAPPQAISDVGLIGGG